MAERFNGWCVEIRTLVNAPTPWQKFAMHVVDPAGPWVDGRTALIGDAAHAMVPFLAQGAAMAIEDAAVLAAALAARPDDVPAAFAAYAAARQPRVTSVWKAAARTGEHYHQTGMMAAARDLVLRVARRTVPPRPERLDLPLDADAVRAATSGRGLPAVPVSPRSAVIRSR